MLFNSGTTSLVSYTRDLAGDPSTAPTPMWSLQRVKDAINESYLELYDVARQFGVGTGEKRSYSDVVADQLYYELPDDFHKLILVEVEGDGKDLSSDSTASPTNLKVLGSDVALEGYGSGIYDETEFYFIHNQHFGIVSPPDTAGSNSIRVTYEAFAADLSGDTDEPQLPGTYHSLICYRAAIVLRSTLGLEVRHLEDIANRKEVRFMRSMHDLVADYEGNFVVAGLQDEGTVTRFGKLVRN